MFLVIIWNYPFIPWHTTTQCYAQIVPGVRMVPIRRF